MLRVDLKIEGGFSTIKSTDKISYPPLKMDTSGLRLRNILKIKKKHSKKYIEKINKKMSKNQKNTCFFGNGLMV